MRVRVRVRVRAVAHVVVHEVGALECGEQHDVRLDEIRHVDVVAL